MNVYSYPTLIFLTAGLLLAGLLAIGCASEPAGMTMTADYVETVDWADPAFGQAAIRTYGCGACHVIPGIAGATGTAGPPLANFGQRAYIAGSLPNTPHNLTRWLQNPQAIEPGTAMPNLAISRAEARDMAAYLYSTGALD